MVHLFRVKLLVGLLLLSHVFGADEDLEEEEEESSEELEEEPPAVRVVCEGPSSSELSKTTSPSESS